MNPQTGAEHLRRALRRFKHAIAPAPPPLPIDAPQPAGNWEQLAEQRIQALEAQHTATTLRFWLLVLATAAADITLEIIKRSS